MRNKLLFTNVEQPIVLEVLGYCITALAGFTHWYLSAHKHWSEYVYTALITLLVACVYRIVVAYHKDFSKFLRSIYETITNVFIRLAGKNPTVLDKKERIRWGVVGVSLLIPFSMAFITIPYLLQTAFDMNLQNTMIITTLAACIIFMLDRTFVATMGYKKTWQVFVIRMLIALPLGLFLARPIELKLFEKETNEELMVQRETKLRNLEKERAVALNEVEERRKVARSERDRARDEYEKEVNNSIGGRNPGHGIEAEKKEKYFKEEDAKYQMIAPKFDQEYKTTDSLYDARKAEYVKGQSDGLGARLQALSKAGEKYPSVLFFSIIITMFLVGLDLSPLIAKFLMPKQKSDREEESEDIIGIHEVEKKKIEHKYDLYALELKKATEMVKDLQVPDEDKERINDLTRKRVTRDYFGTEAFNKN